MPWSDTKDPYKIWISEIILQQTRVAQGWSYYERFIDRFPDLNTLYSGGESEVIRLWEGLGYYSRARNLYRCAVEITEKHNGKFPSNYHSLIALPGIGPYTAAAIASFAFEVPVAVVDGNVIRFISRLLAIENPHNDKVSQNQIREYVSLAIQHGKASSFNQAIMNMGALICKPQSPVCTKCPFDKHCLAFQKNKVDSIPGKKMKPEKTRRHFHYLILEDPKAEEVLIQRRHQNDIWNRLYEFPLIETKNPDVKQVQSFYKTLTRGKGILPEAFRTSKQQLTHQEIHFYFYHHPIEKETLNSSEGMFWAKKESLSEFPMPVTLKKIAKDFITHQR